MVLHADICWFIFTSSSNDEKYQFKEIKQRSKSHLINNDE